MSAQKLHTIKLSLQQHRGEERLFADFPYAKELHAIVKTIPGAKWSATKKMWHFAPNKQTVNLLHERFALVATLDTDLLRKQLTERKKKQHVTTVIKVTPEKTTVELVTLSKTHLLAVRAYVELLRLKNYSGNTISTYKNWFIVFLKHFPNRKPSTLTKYEIMDYLVSFKNSAKWSATSQNQLINAIHPVGLKKAN